MKVVKWPVHHLHVLYWYHKRYHRHVIIGLPAFILGDAPPVLE